MLKNQSIFVYFIVVISMTSLDQILKYLARVFLPGQYIQIIPHFIHLKYVENRGVSFGLFSNLPESFRVIFLTGSSLLILIGILVYLYYSWEKIFPLEKWGMTLIIAGALGNLIDRAFRKSVTDYMYFHFFDYGFFINNFADDIISLGFMLLIWNSLRTNK